MDTSTLIPVLALVTLIAGLVIGVWQFRRARTAEKRNIRLSVQPDRSCGRTRRASIPSAFAQ